MAQWVWPRWAVARLLSCTRELPWQECMGLWNRLTCPFTLEMDTTGPGAVMRAERLCRAPPQKRPHTGPRKDGGLLPGQQE